MLTAKKRTLLRWGIRCWNHFRVRTIQESNNLIIHYGNWLACTLEPALGSSSGPIRHSKLSNSAISCAPKFAESSQTERRLHYENPISSYSSTRCSTQIHKFIKPNSVSSSNLRCFHLQNTHTPKKKSHTLARYPFAFLTRLEINIMDVKIRLTHVSMVANSNQSRQQQQR